MNPTIYYLSAYLVLYFLVLMSFDYFYDHFLHSYLPKMKKWKFIKFRLPILGEIYRGKELLNGFFVNGKSMAMDLPEYKFYTAMIVHLMQYHRTLGIGLKKIIPELRQNLIKDIQFEQKIFSEVSSSFAQFFIICAVTWSFIFLSSSILNLPIRLGYALLIGLLQFFGVVFFLCLLKAIKTKMFSPFNSSFSELYFFSALYEVGVPLNDALLKSQLLSGDLIVEPKLSPLAERILKLIDRLRQNGIPLGAELGEIKGEMWHLLEQEFIKFTKLLQMVKFFTLSFFYLPAYFLYLASIFKFFMEQ